MTNNTDAQITREWAERAMNLDPQDDVPIEGYRSAARYILATTTPPTIADLDSDDEGGLNEKKIPLIDKDSFNDDEDSVNDKTALHPVTLVTEEDYENAPAGKPVPGDYEYATGHVVEYADGQKDYRPRYREDSRQSALTSAEGLKDDGYVAMRRFVADWEEA